MTNRDTLNTGFPTPATPPKIRDVDLQYGNALLGAFGKDTAPTAFGDFLRRIGVVQTGVAVTANTVDVGPGVVMTVQATTASVTGVKTMRLVGAPSSGEVLVEPQADGTQRLTFEGTDGVTAVAVYLLAVSSDLLDFLESATDPP